ncbi:nucleotidyl transferase AbiEii/AbiGii toxin family protein [Kribbella sp. DT2]|uniref:nucleotidyl transferase AbiEii/AbiGii toxin family protein n=1 Tax=Kribbella sp. DT2 TaxID=3393427 RepID=UPI003CFB4CD7
MDQLQKRMATVGLRALARDGFVLAGGYALRAHGFGARSSDDIDLFTDRLDAELFAAAVERLVAAYQADGLKAEVVRQAPLFARVVVDGEAKADLGADLRQFPPVELEVGPVLSEQDAVGSKVGTVYSRLEPRDFMDVQAILDSGRYTTGALLALADRREVTALDRPMFAGQLRAGSLLPDAGFLRYSATPDLIARIRRTATGWADQLDHASTAG